MQNQSITSTTDEVTATSQQNQSLGWPKAQVAPVLTAILAHTRWTVNQSFLRSVTFTCLAHIVMLSSVFLV